MKNDSWEKAESSANRLTTLLKSLSSENVRERQIAVKTAESSP